MSELVITIAYSKPHWLSHSPVFRSVVNILTNFTTNDKKLHFIAVVRLKLKYLGVYAFVQIGV